ncbi:MAG: BatA domain-containing protein [Planctomycetes bacterium]|nr:BatA domain-containing protein [Planctomycetota bacterium]MBI3836252.1 BatA domain-containing protein [Planctomycetota bacterium]
MSQPLAQFLPFVHPALAVVGIAAGTIPIIIHLINRRRHRRVPWAAMTFLLAAMKRSARRMRIEQWLLLAVRVASVVLFALAAARPFVSASPLISRTASRVHRILVIDNTLSMNAKHGSEPSYFERAMGCARSLLASFPTSDPVSVVTLAEPSAAVVANATSDRREVEDRLGTLRAGQRKADVVGAVGHLMEQLKDTSTAPDNKAVYILSDFPVHAWRHESAGPPLQNIQVLQHLAGVLKNPEKSLNLIQVASTSLANVAVTDLRCTSPVIGRRIPAMIQISVMNYGGTTVRDAIVQLRRNGELLRRVTFPRIEPRHTEITTVSAEFLNTGTQFMEARLQGAMSNDLSEDDSRFLSIEVREATKVLLIDGRPGAKPLDGQAGFLAAALNPQSDSNVGVSWTMPTPASKSGEAPIRTKIITESELDGESLTAYDVVVLCNVPSLTPQRWSALDYFAKEGGGVLVFFGDLVNIDNYNRYGFANGQGVLPGRIGHASDPIALRNSAAAGQGNLAPMTIKSTHLLHPIVADFADNPGSGLFLARFEHYLQIEPETRAEVVMQFNNDAPAMIASSDGQGRVIAFASTANMEWNNLPAKGDFVSLMWSTIGFLSPRHGDHRNLIVGATLNESLTPAESSMPLTVRTSIGTAAPSVIPSRDGLALQYGPIEQCGQAEVSIGSESRSFAVNVDPSESDLTTMSLTELAAALERPAQVTTVEKEMEAAPSTAHSAELGSGLMYFVLALLMLEPWLAMWFAGTGARETSRRQDDKTSKQGEGAFSEPGASATGTGNLVGQPRTNRE